MSGTFSADLAAACNALGRYDTKNEVYFNEDNILETVKDLIRYLRRDTENYEIRRYFGAAKILQINLIPLLKLYWKQTELFDVLLRLLGNLTSPALLLYNEEIPTETSVRNHFLEIISHLQSYKEAFADNDLWAVLSTRLSQLLNIEYQERGEDNGLIIERILILARNVLSVPANVDDEKRADNDVSAHDEVLWTLHQSGLVDIIHYMASSDQEETYALYLLEILTLMLREHRAVDIAMACSERTDSEKSRDDTEFLSIRSRELRGRKERLRAYNSVRHSRFGGTYVCQNLKAINDEHELIYHKKLATAESINFDVDKSTAKVANRFRNLQETSFNRRSLFSLRLWLKNFIIEFLNSGYNKLMHTVRGKLVRRQSMGQDESYYLWALRFFMEFNRHYKYDVKLVSETIGQEMFHYIQQRLEHYFDMFFSDKKRWQLWTKRLHLAVQAYKELLLNIIAMDNLEDSAAREHSKIIKSNIFYVVEYREFIFHLFVTYDPVKLSNAYLIDLIELQHYFLKLLQAYCGNDSSMVVQQVKKVRKKKKQQSAPAPMISLEESLEIKWDELSHQLSTVLEGGENIPVIVPFDATSEIPINEQRKDAMIKIQDYLRESEIENAIGLLRAARDVWPDNDSFGSSSMTPAEEFLAIREIFFVKLRDKEELPTPPTEDEEEDEENEEDEEESAGTVDIEVNFKFVDFIKRFAHPKVIQACSLALRRFDTNSSHVNHCILKLLHRIAWDCKMPAMLFQASIFRTFQRIFAEGDRNEFKELLKFSVYVIRQFIKVSEKNSKVFIEMLFWKNSREAFEAEEGYGTYETNSKAKNIMWTEEQENELRVLVMEYKERGIQEDVIDWIINNLVDNTKSRRMVIKKLKELMLLNYKGPNKKSSFSIRPPKNWEETEIEQLTELYNQFKDAMDPLSCIMDRLEVKRPKARIKQKIVELGLADNKALRKKRATKSNGNFDEGNFPSNSQVSSSEDDDDRSNNDDNSSDEENINRTNTSTVMQTKKSIKKSKRFTNKKVIKSQRLEKSILKKLILEIIGNEMSDSLTWISECLTEAAEDQEQDTNLDDNDGIPLVPINAKDMQAINNPMFQKFLLGIGIHKPGNEQEMFWRISGNILSTELNSLANFIKEIVEKGEEAFPEHNEHSSRAQFDDESSDEDVFNHIRTLISKPQNEPSHSESMIENTNEVENTADNSFVEYNLENGVLMDIPKTISRGRIKKLTNSDDSDSNIQSENKKSNDQKKKANRIKELSDSEPENLEIHIRKEQEHTLDRDNNSVKEKRRIFEDSDESDSENMREEQNQIREDNVLIKKSKKKQALEFLKESDLDHTSDTSETISKRNRGSDSESESHSTMIKRKKLRIIDSDED